MLLRRTALLVVSASAVSAKLASIYSSSITNCYPSGSITIYDFDARYFKHNGSLLFDLTASSVHNDLNVTAKIGLKAFGMEPLNITFNLCELSKTMCPLPKRNVSWSGAVPIPELQSYIPGITWFIPDLEVTTQLTLTQLETREVVGCAQATMSNGLSLRQKGISWAIGGLLVAMFFMSVMYTLRQSTIWVSSRPRLAPTFQPLLYRWISLLLLCQTIVSSALLHLDYPSSYRSYAINFSWAFGLFPSSRRSALQRSMLNLRDATGSKTAESSGLDKLPAGIPQYVNSIGIVTGNAFLSVLYSTLMLMGSVGVLAVVGYWLLWCLDKWLPRDSQWQNRGVIKEQYWIAIQKIILRVTFICVIPTFTMGLYQWTIGDSWLATLLSVLLVLFVGSIVGYSSFRLVNTLWRPQSTLPSSTSNQLSPRYLQAYTEPYIPTRWNYTLFPLLQFVLKSAFTAFAKSSGLTQVIAFTVIDLSAFVLLVILRPYTRIRSDLFEGFLCIVKLVMSSFLIVFVERIGVKPIPRAILAFVMAIVYSIAIIMCFLNLLVNLWLQQAWTGKGLQNGQKLEMQGIEEDPKSSVKNTDSPQTSDASLMAIKIVDSAPCNSPVDVILPDLPSGLSPRTELIPIHRRDTLDRIRIDAQEADWEDDQSHSVYSVDAPLTLAPPPTARLSAFGQLDAASNSDSRISSHSSEDPSPISAFAQYSMAGTPSPRTPTFDNRPGALGRLTPGHSSLGGRDSPYSTVFDGRITPTQPPRSLRWDAESRRAHTSTPGTFGGGRESPTDYFSP